MALLRFMNIASNRPDNLLKDTFFGLNDFYKYLSGTKKYLESPEAIDAVFWTEVEKSERCDDGFWINLLPVDGNVTAEKTLRSFMEENTQHVYDSDESSWNKIGAAARYCVFCRKKAYQSREHAEEIVNQSERALTIYHCQSGDGWHLTSNSSNDAKYKLEHRLVVLDRLPEYDQIKLDRKPHGKILVIRPDTYQINCQLRAIKQLQGNPDKKHRPLLRLLETKRHASWPVADCSEFAVPQASAIGHSIVKRNPLVTNEITAVPSPLEWKVLLDDNRPGNSEQREFVLKALVSPDYTFLDGPPGSGKTTAICELILQMALRKKRVLLCASTHVAIDNVLERLLVESEANRKLVMPLRIGEEKRLSPKVKSLQLKEFVKTEKRRLLKELSQLSVLEPAQKEMRTLLSGKAEDFEKIVLDSSNLVCGTTIGILQHPGVKAANSNVPMFDMLIIDEASKTTFQEFLVPALLAERWVVVGDPKQLSPYVESESLEIGVADCLPSEDKRRASVDVFHACQHGARNRRNSLICTSDVDLQKYYKNQAASNDVNCATAQSDVALLPYSTIVVGDSDFFHSHKNEIPLDISSIRGDGDLPVEISRRVRAYNHANKNIDTDAQWEKEISWRIVSAYEQRNSTLDAGNNKTLDRLKSEIENLMPSKNGSNYAETKEKLDRVRRVALPSIMESLKNGFGSNGHRDTALTGGLPDSVYQKRSTVLTHQHRMHPDIAEFPHRYIYEKQALFTSDSVAKDRVWGYKSTRPRSVWLDVKGHKSNANVNGAEVKSLLSELKEFDHWARKNPKQASDGNKPWEVAVITFYRGQEKALRQSIRSWTGSKNSGGYFDRSTGSSVYLTIKVATVDRFQGQEADLVLLSFASPHKTPFLECANRLNVAITRARYQLVVVGNHNGLSRSSGVLGSLCKFTPWEKNL